LQKTKGGAKRERDFLIVGYSCWTGGKMKEKGERGLTIEKLRKFKGFENVKEDEAEEVIETLKILALITYQLYHQPKRKII
jgi:hypothetical protein